MIVLNLSCGNRHSFEGWFASLAEFQRQAGQRMVTCPHCNDATITKLPAGSHVRRALPVKDADRSAADRPDAAKLQAALAEILRDSEDVGSNFPDEARKIHYAEVPLRNIHGTASIAEVHSLLEENIEVLPLPSLRRKNMH